MTAILDTNHMIETPHQELLPAIAEAPSPTETAQAEQIAGTWPEPIRKLPQSINRVAAGAGMLAVGVRGPTITKEMVGAFHDTFPINFSVTGSLIAAGLAGGLYATRGIQRRFSKSRSE